MHSIFPIYSEDGKYYINLCRDERGIHIILGTSENHGVLIQQIVPLAQFLKELDLFPTCLADIPPVEHM